MAPLSRKARRDLDPFPGEAWTVTETGLVYLAAFDVEKRTRTDRVKIGTSDQDTTAPRLRQLGLREVWYAAGGVHTEGRLHDEFAEDRDPGTERFYPSFKLIHAFALKPAGGLLVATALTRRLDADAVLTRARELAARHPGVLMTAESEWVRLIRRQRRESVDIDAALAEAKRRIQPEPDKDDKDDEADE